MGFQYLLGWFHWDPSRELFVVPIIDRPVMWYGMFWVLGFVLAYFIVAHIFNRKILFAKEIFPSHIENWPLLIQTLQNEKNNELLQKTYQQLDPKFRKEISTYQYGEEISPGLKKAILHALDTKLVDPEFYDPSLANNLQLSSKTQRWLKKKNPTYPCTVQNRLLLEDLFPKAIMRAYNLSIQVTDRYTWFILGGTIIGARLGQVFFYDWSYYSHNILEIFKIWNGGLASHGGTIGALLGAYFSYQKNRTILPTLSFIAAIDVIGIGTAVTATCIRLGNFFNQEILGIPTSVPWAVIFEHPFDGSAAVPRHPAQLYEAICYFLTFILLYSLWSFSKEKLKTGILSGLFFILVFTSRFFIEFIKAPQGGVLDESFLQTGQYLSIPFIILGIWLLFSKRSQSSMD